MTKEWYQKCKDCGKEFGYSDYTLQSDLKKGLSRLERCKNSRDKHSIETQSIASSHFGLIPRKEKRSILGLPYLGHIEHGTRILYHKIKDPDTSGMDLGMTDKHMTRIYKTLENHQVLVIVAPTGTGKSTYIPFRLIEPLEGYEKDKFTKHGPIVVTQPRIPAASGIPKAIGDKLMGSHVGPGFEIGYRHGDMSGENKGEVFDRRNRLLFVTDGSLLNWITEGKIGDYSMIIVDEAHERSTNIDLILGLIKQELLKYPHLKLIIASATIDANSFVNYFSEVADTKLLDFADCQKSYGYEEIPWKAKEEDMIERLVDNDDPEVKNKLKTYQEDIIKKVADNVLEILDETDEGGILGFLQGQPEIDKAVEKIKDGVEGRKDIKVFPLYTKLGKERIDEAIKEFEESDKTRRVVIATNIAETSITIRDIVYVVDSGLIKQSEWNPTTCRQELITRFHSKDGCKQRWGRAGRVQKGYAYKLYGKEDFIKYFSLHTSPEITRDCLDDVVLRAKASGVQDVDPSKFSWIENPPEDELNRALNVFNERELVDQDNDMTEDGREVYRLSNRISRFLEDTGHNSTNRALDVATMLILADKYACLIEAVTALVMMSHMGNSLYWDNEGLLLWDKKWDIQSKDHITRLHNELRMGCIDDLDFACKLFALYEGKISGIPDAILNSWRKRYFINEENFKLIKEAREDILDEFTQGKKTNVLRPIDFSLVERVRLLMAITWPDRIVSIKKCTPLRFVYSKTNMEGIISENATGNWANQKEAIVAIMDQSDIVINGNKKGAPVANFIIQTPEEIPSKEATDIISKIRKIRNEYNLQKTKTLSSLFTHLHAPIGARVNVDSSSKQLKVSDAVLPTVFQPTFDKSLSTKDKDDSDSSDLDHEKHPESRERGHKKGKNFHYLPLTKKPIEIKPNFKIGWSNEITGDQAFVENWKDINGEPIAILNTIDPVTDNRVPLKNIQPGDKVNLILKRVVFDMLQRKMSERKIIIIGFIAENEDGITFPIPASNLSIEQNNPRLYRLENQKLDFRFIGKDSLTNCPLFTILPELETDLKDLIEKKEVEAYVEKITVENIYYSIIGDKNVIHSAKQPLSFVSEFISDLSIGEKVILNIESLVEYRGEVDIGVKSTLSSKYVEDLEKFGIREGESRLYCDEPISYEDLRKIQGLLPELYSDLRGLYTLSHQLRVLPIVEIQKVFRALQKEALEIKNMAIDNVDTQSRVKEMQEKIKSKNVRLSSKSFQNINNILNDAWELSYLPGKKSFLKRQEDKLERQEANLAKNEERLRNLGNDPYANSVREWIAEDEYRISETGYKISNVKKEIEELEKMIQ